jgi:hypothetical protein
MNRLISPVDDDWKPEGAAASAIAAWEHGANQRLPDDYRRFMLRYNGGRPYPNMFRHTALDPDGFASPSEAFVDPFYDWKRVESWSGELANRLPPKCLAIGADPGLLEIVLSLRDEDHGAIFSWVRNWGVWGSAENSYLCAQAASFAAFVAALFDDDAQSGHAFWHTPRRDRLKRTIEI